MHSALLITFFIVLNKHTTRHPASHICYRPVVRAAQQDWEIKLKKVAGLGKTRFLSKQYYFLFFFLINIQFLVVFYLLFIFPVPIFPIVWDSSFLNKTFLVRTMYLTNKKKQIKIQKYFIIKIFILVNKFSRTYHCRFCFISTLFWKPSWLKFLNQLNAGKNTIRY